MNIIQAVVFDWGDTLMRDLGFAGAMVDWPKVELVPGVDGALTALRDRYTLCVASNAGDSDAGCMARALERAGICDYFDCMWTSRELGANKPDSAFFKGVLDRLHLPGNACVMVGNDYAKDIEPAKASGMWTVWLAPLSAPDAPAADATIHALNDLDSAIERLSKEQER